MAGEIILELSKYEVFLKTVELGNITQAADVLGYTQPAVSRVIADLERESPKFVRSALPNESWRAL